MDTDQLVLLIVHAAGGAMRGKTLLQKRGYFLSVAKQLDLGYRAHYYGPYSAEVESGLSKAKALGFIGEQTSTFSAADKKGFERKRYDYTLTPDGQHMVDSLRRRQPAEFDEFTKILQKVKSLDNDDYMALSIGAKTHYVLDKAGKPLTEDAIKESARELGWDVEEKDADEAVELLLRMGLAERVG